MSGIFGTKASLLYDVNLMLQIVIIILLIGGRKFAKDRKLINHGMIMTIAAVLHTISILLIMGPSFVLHFTLLLGYSFSLGVIVTWIHAIVGILAEALGVFLVAKWKFQLQSTMTCAKRRKIMLPTFALWIFALALGIGFYAFYYL